MEKKKGGLAQRMDLWTVSEVSSHNSVFGRSLRNWWGNGKQTWSVSTPLHSFVSRLSSSFGICLAWLEISKLWVEGSGSIISSAFSLPSPLTKHILRQLAGYRMKGMLMGMVAQARNPSYLRGWGRSSTNSRSVSATWYKLKKLKKGWEHSACLACARTWVQSLTPEKQINE